MHSFEDATAVWVRRLLSDLRATCQEIDVKIDSREEDV